MQSFIHKVWDRGIDITVGLISSIGTAAIAFLFWKAKLWLDAKSHAQSIEMDERARQDRERGEFEERHQKIIEDYTRLLTLAKKTAKLQNVEDKRTQMISIWNDYWQWIEDNGLGRYPGNIAARARTAAPAMWFQTSGNVIPSEQHCDFIIDTIRDTELPKLPPDDEE
jgi:hypothetical protein